ncbi:MAG: methionine adenosyltransferase domain-containing protein [Terracidiphilus sp.]|jgi:S-adenosylmethionine synthetase
MDWPAIHTGLQASCLLLSDAVNFEVAGPEGENSLSGKKLVVDSYGPQVPIGGGAVSGKDFFKADRADAIMARRLATKRPSRLSEKEVLDTVASG